MKREWKKHIAHISRRRLRARLLCTMRFIRTIDDELLKRRICRLHRIALRISRKE